MLNPDPDAVLARLRAFCLALPETTEKPVHGVPGFYVAGKLFAHFRHDHQGDGMTVAGVRISGRDEQEALLTSRPEIYSVRSSASPANWIAMSLAEPDWALVEARLLASWRLAAPKRLLPLPLRGKGTTG